MVFEEISSLPEEDLHTFAQELSVSLIDYGMESHEIESRLFALSSAMTARVPDLTAICEKAIQSQIPALLFPAIHCIGNLQDRYAEKVLFDLTKSRILPLRLEATYHLSLRKSEKALYSIQSLMSLLPSEYHFLFPDLIAPFHQKEATVLLQSLSHHKSTLVKVSLIHSLRNNNRDDFLPFIFSQISHKNVPEQEAALSAILSFGDLSKKELIHSFLPDLHGSCRVIALHYLLQTGDESAKEELRALVEKKDPYAIASLWNLPEFRPLLKTLLYDKSSLVRANAAYALLLQKDPSCLSTISEILLSNPTESAMLLSRSPGGSIMCLKPVASIDTISKITETNLLFEVEHIKRELLTKATLLPQPSFLSLARRIIDAKQLPLATHAIALLESIGSEEAKKLLQEYVNLPGFPLIRNASLLSLYRLSQDNEIKSLLKQWSLSCIKHNLIRLKPIIPWSEMQGISHYDLLPEDRIGILFEFINALIETSPEEALSLIIEMMKSAPMVNRIALAGLLFEAAK